jgi:hypothetical protein
LEGFGRDDGRDGRDAVWIVEGMKPLPGRNGRDGRDSLIYPYTAKNKNILSCNIM